MAFDFSYPNKPANERGWGPGYPDCQDDKMVTLTAAGVSFGRIHRRIHDLVELLVEETARRGYAPKAGQCGGFVCRCSHRSDGTCAKDSAGNEIPSNHSWGLAIDYNWRENVYGAPASSSVIWTKHRWMIRLWKDYGFRYLGTAEIHDWMHYDFAGNPKDATRMLEKARANLEPRFTVAGKTFQKFSKAARRVKRLLDEGRSKVTVKRR